MCDYEIESGLQKLKYRYICGLDEVGRGAMFGPVVSGAVILNPERLNFEIKDSKKLSPAKRIKMASDIYRDSLDYSIGWCWNDDIDRINIVEATKKSMQMAIKKMHVRPDYVLVDSLNPDFLKIKGRGIIKGDNISLSIAAASIIAKVFRDQLMVDFSRFFPDFQFENNKGYPTQKHLNMISLRAKTYFHRKSFKWKNGKGK